MKVSLKVNGKPTSVDAPSDMPLLWILRDMLDLKGTKYGCGVGQCGACTVHLKGTPVRSCQLPVSALQGAEIICVPTNWVPMPGQPDDRAAMANTHGACLA